MVDDTPRRKRFASALVAFTLAGTGLAVVDAVTTPAMAAPCLRIGQGQNNDQGQNNNQGQGQGRGDNQGFGQGRGFGGDQGRGFGDDQGFGQGRGFGDDQGFGQGRGFSDDQGRGGQELQAFGRNGNPGGDRRDGGFDRGGFDRGGFDRGRDGFDRGDRDGFGRGGFDRDGRGGFGRGGRDNGDQGNNGNAGNGGDQGNANNGNDGNPGNGVGQGNGDNANRGGNGNAGNGGDQGNNGNAGNGGDQGNNGNAGNGADQGNANNGNDGNPGNGVDQGNGDNANRGGNGNAGNGAGQGNGDNANQGDNGNGADQGDGNNGNQGDNGGGQAGCEDVGPALSDFADVRTFPRVRQVRFGDNGSRGTFISRCGTNQNGHFNSDNHIVAPGVSNGAQHQHDYVGNLTTNGQSTDESLAAGGTTCARDDRSAYFWPVLRDRTRQGNDANQPGGGQDGNIGRILTPRAAIMEFRGNPQSKVVAAPRFLRVITGDAKAAVNGAANARAGWTCSGFTDRISRDKYPLCPRGSLVTRILDFPSCWDGQNLDSANHRTHVVFPDDNGACPQGTQAIPQLRMTLMYSAPPGPNFAVDTFPDQKHAPVTDHADFHNVMPENLMNFVVDCINSGRRC